MSNYLNEAKDLDLWRFYCLKKAERLNKYSTIGIGISDREVAEIEINKEYYKRLAILKQRYGTSSIVTTPQEHLFERLAT